MRATTTPANAAAGPRHAPPSLAARLFRWHRWLGWVVGLQVLAWVLGGALFAWLPFQAWVKGREAVSTPQLALPVEALARSATALAQLPGPVTAMQAVPSAAGPAWRVRVAGGAEPRWLRADGQPWAPPDAAAVQAFAAQLYRGGGPLAEVRHLGRAPQRLGIVREAQGGAQGLWRVRFDDALQTRLYVDAHSGELLAVRNEAWVWYDFFWRLHVMDWPDGEDFNTPWLRAAALVALGLMLTGAVMSLRAAWRAVRRGAGHRR
ncbi:PepSY domain-containing protein [Ideonella sp. DXS22W]|uniref:PepSY domain-containing protein n=1 Tax=Pseudaquabacterium inlustre TaxID=2984192 RepID=A0ABU9CAW2_9BURK